MRRPRVVKGRRKRRPYENVASTLRRAIAARVALEQFARLSVTERTDMDAAFREDVAQLKADWRRVSLADCCGLALVRRLDAEFVIADHHEMDVLRAANVAKIRFFR